MKLRFFSLDPHPTVLTPKSNQPLKIFKNFKSFAENLNYQTTLSLTKPYLLFNFYLSYSVIVVYVALSFVG